jgi:putative membrane protein
MRRGAPNYAEPVTDGDFATAGGPGDPADPLTVREAADRRRPRSVYGVGSDPDPRFSMANERTALAWVRTGLGLLAGGVALTSVASVTGLPSFLDVVSVLACLFGAFTAINALLSWQRAERALRLGEPLPAPNALRWLVVLVILAAVVVAGYAVAQTPR